MDNLKFKNKPIIGMIHLSGDNVIKRALEEIAIYEEEGVDAAIVENYHGSDLDVMRTLRELKLAKPKLLLGVNLLPNEFINSFELAKRYGAGFIQLDHVSGRYVHGSKDCELDAFKYYRARKEYTGIAVLGGVWPKYYTPFPGSNLEKDLDEGKQRAEAIVVTGEGTGKETPLEKILKFREALGSHPLIIGAGLNMKNIHKQLPHCEGAIVGSYFKPNSDTTCMVDRKRVKDFMDAVKDVRKYSRA